MVAPTYLWFGRSYVPLILILLRAIMGKCALIMSKWTLIRAKWTLIRAKWTLIRAKWTLIRAKWTLIRAKWTLVRAKCRWPARIVRARGIPRLGCVTDGPGPAGSAAGRIRIS
jgi:hypothetical protein